MNYALEHSFIQGCLRIRVTGTWPSQKVEEVISDMFSLWELNQKPILIDIRGMTDTPSVLRDYLSAEQFAKAGFRRVGRVAVLDNPERHDANDFFETTAHNRGLTFRFFYAGEQEAIEWLISDKEGYA